MMKRLFLSLVSLMLTLQWFVIGAGAAKTINVAYPSPSWNTSLPVSMAKEFGLFAAEGLEVQPVYVRGGPVVMAALLGGDADFAVIAGVTAVTSIQRGADIVIVGGHTAYIDQVLHQDVDVWAAAFSWFDGAHHERNAADRCRSFLAKKSEPKALPD
jgi:hypothetical protein